MVSKAEKKIMIDYLYESLKGSEKITMGPKKCEIVSGINTHLLGLGDDGALIIVDQQYPGESLELVYNKIRAQRPRTTAVLYKDGKTFFRNAAETNGFKQRYGLSLKNYNVDEVHRMIQMRPEELFLDRKKDYVQYYQPKSDKLEESIVTYRFTPVRFDYSHINHFAPNSGYELSNTDSKRIMIQKKVGQRSGSLKLAQISSTEKVPVMKPDSYYLINGK